MGMVRMKINPSEGEDAETAYFVRADMERPIGEREVYPVLRRAERLPVGAHGRIGRSGKIERLARTGAVHHEAVREVLRRQRPRSVRRGDGREVSPLLGVRRDGDVAPYRIALWQNIAPCRTGLR